MISVWPLGRTASRNSLSVPRTSQNSRTIPASEAAGAADESRQLPSGASKSMWRVAAGRLESYLSIAFAMVCSCMFDVPS